MRFANPHLLWLLLVLPPTLLLFFWWSWRKRQELMTLFIRSRLLPGLVAGVSPTRQKFRLGGLVLAVICLILALARPQWGFTWQEVKQRGVDIVVAIDTSKSMLAEDIAPNRLGRAKLAALELMQQAKSDRLGLVAFAGSAFLQCPLTIDETAFRQSVESLNTNSIPQGGTALAQAIETALTAFKEGDNFKILVLMTDGEDHDSGALEAAKKAAEAGMHIYTIGIGTAQGELLRLHGPNGDTDYIRDEQGNVVKSHLNEQLLQEIAGATEGGFYLPLRGAKTIDTLYAEGLAKLPKSEHQEKLVKQYHERFQWPLLAALLLLLAEMLLPERPREAKVKSHSTASAEPVLRQALPLLLLLALPASLWGSPGGALRDYKAGHYDQALEQYEKLLQKNNDDPRLHFNAGAAAYRNRQFDAAAKHFNDALTSPDLKLQEQAYYNRGNSLYWLGESTADPAKRTESWEKALKDFESSLKLNQRDPDAKFNHEFVKKRLEELKQQQQQSQQNKPDQQKNQDQNQQPQNQQNDQSRQDQNQQQQQQQAQQNQPQQKQNSSRQQDQPKPQNQQQQATNQSKGQKDKPQQPQSAQTAKPSDKKENPSEQEAAAAEAAGEMTPEQAQQLLDAQKGDEQLLPPQLQDRPVDRKQALKDW